MNSNVPDDLGRPIIFTTQPPDEWGAALIVACLALGFVASWGTYEMHQRVAQQSGEIAFRRDFDVLVSQQSDLGHLLADPRTRIVPFMPIGDASPVRVASIAWNQQSQSGAIFCQDLAAAGERQYQIWLIPAVGDPIPVTIGPARSGRAIYPFSPVRPASPLSEIVMTPQIQTLDSNLILARGKMNQQD